MSQDNPSICDFTIKLSFRDYDFGYFTTNYEVFLSLRSDNCILEFPSRVFDVQELNPVVELPMLMPFTKVFTKMAIQVTEIILAEKATFVSSRLETIAYPNENPRFSRLKIGVKLTKQYSGEMVQFMSLYGFDLTVYTPLACHNLWLEFQTPFFSVRARYKPGSQLRNLFLPDNRTFMVKLQHYCLCDSYEEFVTLQQLLFEKSPAIQRGHLVKINLVNTIDPSLFDTSKVLSQCPKLVPCDFLSEMFALEDTNFDEFARSRKYSSGKDSEQAGNFVTQWSFIIGVSMPVASNYMEFATMSAYVEKSRGDSGGLLMLGVEGNFDYGVVSLVDEQTIMDVAQNVQLRHYNLYSIRLEKHSSVPYKVFAPLLRGDYYNTLPCPLAYNDFGLAQLFQEVQAVKITLYSGETTESIDMDLQNMELLLTRCCTAQKDHAVYLPFALVIFGIAQRNTLRRSSSALLSSRFKNHSVEAGLFGSQSYSSMANYSSTTNSVSCQNHFVQIGVDASAFYFLEDATHYSSYIRLSFSNGIIELGFSLQEIHETSLKFYVLIPVQFYEQDFTFDLSVLQFNGDQFKVLAEQVYQSYFLVAKQMYDRIFYRRNVKIPYRVFMYAYQKPYRLLYLNFTRIGCSINDLFNPHRELPLFCEIYAAGCLQRRRLEEGKLNFVFPCLSGVSNVLFKVGVLIYLAGHFEIVYLQSFWLKFTQKQAEQGIIVEANATDYLSPTVVYNVGEALKNLYSTFPSGSSDALPPDYFRYIFGVPQVDNNDIAFTPHIEACQGADIRFATHIELFVKLSALALFQQNYYLTYTDYIAQVYTYEPCFIISPNLPKTWTILARNQNDTGNQVQFSGEGQYNYAFSVSSNSTTIIAFQPESQIMTNIWCPMTIVGELPEECFLNVRTPDREQNIKCNIMQYYVQVSRCMQDNLDFQIPGLGIPFSLAYAGKLAKVHLSALIETIDNDSDEDLEYPFTEVLETARFIQNDALLIQNMRKYQRKAYTTAGIAQKPQKGGQAGAEVGSTSQAKQKAYEKPYNEYAEPAQQSLYHPLFAVNADISATEFEHIDQQLRAQAPNYAQTENGQYAPLDVAKRLPKVVGNQRSTKAYYKQLAKATTKPTPPLREELKALQPKKSPQRSPGGAATEYAGLVKKANQLYAQNSGRRKVLNPLRK